MMSSIFKITKKIRCVGLMGLALIAAQPAPQLQATRIETFFKAGLVAPLLAGFYVEHCHARTCPRCHYRIPESFPYLYRGRGWARSLAEIVRNAGGAAIAATLLCSLSLSDLELSDSFNLPVLMVLSYVAGSFFGSRV